jgi:membrane associated rhomboid family serine protease
MLLPLYDLNPHSRFPWLTLLIIALNLGATIWMSTLSEMDQTEVAVEYGFLPARLTHVDSGKAVVVPLQALDPRTGKPEVIGRFQLSTEPAEVYRTLFTTMFLHGGWGHLLMNMWMLWIFGNNVEDRLGHLLFVVFYLVGGLIATLVFWFTDSHGVTPVIGASGAVAAVLGGYAVTYPTAKVRTLIFFVIIILIRDLPALLLLGIWFLMQLLSGLMGLWGVALEPVAFWAHIGGFVAGMILMPILSLGAAPPGRNWRQESDEMFRF